MVFDEARGMFCLSIGRNSFHGGKIRSPHFTAYQALRNASIHIDGKMIVRAGTIT